MSSGCARVCVDLACLLRPGEGLLVGSFARALALVHSECAASAYIASRPFRVNAGPARPPAQRYLLSHQRCADAAKLPDKRACRHHLQCDCCEKQALQPWRCNEESIHAHN